MRNSSAVLLHERVQQAGEDAVQLHEEVFLPHDLGQALRFHDVAGYTREAIGIDPLSGQKRGRRCDIARRRAGR